MTEDKEVCSTIEAAKLLGVGVRTVQLWMDSGVLRGWKTAGGHRRVSIDSVQEMLQSRNSMASPPWETAGFRILVLEDSNHLQNLYRLHILNWNLPISIITADDGFDALLKIGKSKPDLFITDVEIPGIHGLDMIRHLKLHPEHANLQIVAISNLTPNEVAARGGLPEGVPLLQKQEPFPLLKELVETMVASRSRRSF